MANFTPLRAIGIVFGFMMIIFGIFSAITPLYFIFKSKIYKSQFMEITGKISRVDYVSDEVRYSSRRSRSTTHYVSMDIKEYPNFIFLTESQANISYFEIKRIIKSLKVGDTIKMVIEKSDYTYKLTKPFPEFSKKPKNRRASNGQYNYRFINVLGYKKGNQEIFSFEKYVEGYNSPAGFFSYFFLCFSICLGLSGVIIFYKSLRNLFKKQHNPINISGE